MSMVVGRAKARPTRAARHQQKIRGRTGVETRGAYIGCRAEMYIGCSMEIPVLGCGFSAGITIATQWGTATKPDRIRAHAEVPARAAGMAVRATSSTTGRISDTALRCGRRPALAATARGTPREAPPTTSRSHPSDSEQSRIASGKYRRVANGEVLDTKVRRRLIVHDAIENGSPNAQRDCLQEIHVVDAATCSTMRRHSVGIPCSSLHAERRASRARFRARRVHALVMHAQYPTATAAT